MNFQEILDIATQHGIQGDSYEYHMLYDACQMTNDIDGVVCEIGVREGLGSLLLMLSGNPNRVYIGIDPYGNIEYQWKDTVSLRYDYTDKMKRKFLKEIYNIAYEYERNYQLFNMTDSQFFIKFSDGIPIYNETEYVLNTYSLVFFDGPHTTDIINSELDFFLPRTPIRGMYIFDDVVEYYNHDSIENRLFENGFSLHQSGSHKKVYIRNTLDKQS